MDTSKRSSNFFKAFERYGVFTDVKKLIESSAKPLRKSKRVNTLKCCIEEFKHWAKAKKWAIEPVPWCPEGFFVDRENREEAIGKDLLHILGYTYMQEAASMLPVVLLDPQPGETVLDMSAAPGSKATQIAAALTKQNPNPNPNPNPIPAGILVANDVQEKRIWALLSNLQRCGAVNVMVTRKVGQWFAGNMTEYFDRVLCDAPCTAQGTVRKDSDALMYCSMENTGKMARLQRELLESAIHATKVGGRIVYSTCTLTPEENEGVVLSILNKYCDQLKVVDPRGEDLGLRTWDKGKTIEDSMRVQEYLQKYALSPNSKVLSPFLRLWPQTFDTEGFFAAVLEKRAPTRDRGTKKNEPHRFECLPPARAREVSSRLEEWYGAEFLREGEALMATSEQLYVFPREFQRFRIPLSPSFVGLPFGKTTTHGLVRFSHEMATLRGHEATRQILTLSEDDLRRALQGKDLASDLRQLEDGDVLLGIKDEAFDRPIIVGRGLLKEGKILNRLPREIVRMFT